MYNSYIKSPVAGKLPLQLDCIACRENEVFAGTKNGYLLTYTYEEAESSSSPVMSMCKSFSKKSVSQIVVVSDLLISLSDNVVSVHDCLKVNYPVIATVPSKTAISHFTLHIKSEEGDGIDGALFSICIVCKRRIQMFEWKNGEFVEMKWTDLTFAETPRSVVWCDDALAVSLREEYFVCRKDPSAGKSLTSLFTTGNKVIEPFIVAIPDKKLFGFVRDERMLFRNFCGDVVSSQSEVLWTDVPLNVVYDPPYLIALLPKCIEIRSLYPTCLIQIIELQKMKLMQRASNLQVFVGSHTDLFMLSGSLDLKNNIQQFVKDRQYELAAQLAENIRDEPEEEKEKRIKDIKNLHAFNLFCQKKFSEAFALYRENRATELCVIGLFPDLLPSEIRKQIQYPGNLPNDLTQQDLNTGLVALQEYLSEIRTEIARELETQKRLDLANPDDVAKQKPDSDLKEKQNLLQILDTTLLKCYLRTNDMLVSSLLRLSDNSCNVSECERVLKKHKKYSELFLLYERKGMHTSALELLQQQSRTVPANANRILIDRTVQYLQNLGDTNLDLVFKHAGWVLRQNPAEGLKIFIEEIPEVENLPREPVLEFLKREAHAQLIPYLEHVVFKWLDPTPVFHDNLGEEYVLKVKNYLEEYLQSLPEGHTVAPAGSEPGEWGEMRSKLLHFLEFSQYYNPDLLLVQIPHDAMYEERALLLGRLSRHEQALAIYTNILHNNAAAEEYCRKHYSKEAQNADVYLLLLQMYAKPPENSVIGVMHSHLPKPFPNVSQALRVLKDYSPYIDAMKAVELLPRAQKLNSLWGALETLLKDTGIARRDSEIRRGLYFSQKLRVETLSFRWKNVKLIVSHDTLCVKCRKRIGNSAFARFPDSTLVHYYCYKQDAAESVFDAR